MLSSKHSIFNRPCIHFVVFGSLAESALHVEIEGKVGSIAFSQRKKLPSTCRFDESGKPCAILTLRLISKRLNDLSHCFAGDMACCQRPDGFRNTSLVLLTRTSDQALLAATKPLRCKRVCWSTVCWSLGSASTCKDAN